MPAREPRSARRGAPPSAEQVQAALAPYPSVVLSYLDDEGYPRSLRCEARVRAQGPGAVGAVVEVGVRAALLFPASPPQEPSSAATSAQAGGSCGSWGSSGIPASLLAHSHDERLWRQTSVLLRGRLRVEGPLESRQPGSLSGSGSGSGSGSEDATLVFDAQRLVPGVRQGLVAFVGFVLRSRRQAARYLDRRGLSRPEVPWAEIAALRDRVQGRSQRGAGRPSSPAPR